jgi:hypothetical protein
VNTKYAGGEEITWTGIAAFSQQWRFSGGFCSTLSLDMGDTTAISSHISYALQTCLQGLMIPTTELLLTSQPTRNASMSSSDHGWMPDASDNW